MLGSSRMWHSDMVRSLARFLTIKGPLTWCPSCGDERLGHESGSCLDAFTASKQHLYWTNDIWRFVEAMRFS